MLREGSGREAPVHGGREKQRSCAGAVPQPYTAGSPNPTGCLNSGSSRTLTATFGARGAPVRRRAAVTCSSLSEEGRLVATALLQLRQTRGQRPRADICPISLNSLIFPLGQAQLLYIPTVCFRLTSEGVPRPLRLFRGGGWRSLKSDEHRSGLVPKHR